MNEIMESKPMPDLNDVYFNNIRKKARLWDIQVEMQKLQQEGAKLQQELQDEPK